LGPFRGKQEKKKGRGVAMKFDGDRGMGRESYSGIRYFVSFKTLPTNSP
jgi:hypothetical protein